MWSEILNLVSSRCG